MFEEKKLLEQFKKDQDSLIKKAKLADNELKKAKQELENFQVNKNASTGFNVYFKIFYLFFYFFQKEKQKKINSLDIAVTMRLNQLQFLDKGRLPNDLSNALAFDSNNLISLQSRIKGLQQEKSSEKKLFKFGNFSFEVSLNGQINRQLFFLFKES